MSPIEMPSAATIKKFARPGQAEPTPVVVVEKNGAPVYDKSAPTNSQWMDVTPAMAASWLKNNFRNRPVAEDVVTAYARDMINGVWQPTHQGIAFNDRDELIDGQHRLMAVVKADRTIRMMVTFGLPSKIEGSAMTTMDCVDRGRTRTVADQLKIQHGLRDGTQITQVGSALAGLCCERIRRPSVDQILKLYAAFKEPMDFVIANRSKSPGLKSAGVLAGFAFVQAGNEKTDSAKNATAKMFAALNTAGQGLEFYPVIKQLHAFLTADQASLILASMNRGIAELTVQALWLELLHREVKLEFSLDGVNHFRAVQPERVALVAAMFKLPETIKPKVEPAQPRAEIKCVEPAPEPAPAKQRPGLDAIFSKVENYFKISKFIITGRGKDSDLDAARVVFVYLARSFGHTAGVTAAALKRTEEQIRDLTLPLAAMSSKQKKAVESIKVKL